MSIGLQLLNAIVTNGSRAAFRQMPAELFLPEERPAYDFMLDYWRQHQALPTIEVLAANGLRLAPADAPVGYYLERARNRAIYNRVAEAFADDSRLRSLLAQRDIGGLVKAVRDLNIDPGTFRETNNDAQNASEGAVVVREDYETSQQVTSLRGVTYGWQPLDDVTQGAMAGTVTTIVARPNAGKSYALIRMANKAWQAGHSVLFVSMEMPNLQTGRRLIGLLAGLNPDLIRRGRLSEWGEQILHETVASLSYGAPFHMVSGSFHKSVLNIDLLIGEFQPDVVYIDASYLLWPEKKDARRARWENMAEVGEGIQKLALKWNRPIIQTVQFNREGKDKNKAGLENIGGTDIVGQVSSVVLGLFPGDSPHEITRRKIKILKNRDQALGEFQINYLFNPPDLDWVQGASADTDAPPLDLEWQL
jgi:replicative DNA helicase